MKCFYIDCTRSAAYAISWLPNRRPGSKREFIRVCHKHAIEVLDNLTNLGIETVTIKELKHAEQN